MKKLTDKIALVTGGSRGIGAAIVKRLAAEGAKVVFTYANSPEKASAVVAEVEAAGGLAVALKASSIIPAEVTGAVAKTIADFGHIDILINNAGIYIGKAFEEHTLEDYNEIMAVNVQAVFVAALAAVKGMPEGGRIITIGSNMGDNAVGPETTLYTMSKSALQGFTRGLARDLGARKITVNLIQPGPINTDMNPADAPLADFLRTRMALPDYGTVEDIASFVSFIASEEARYITGSFLTIDGGLNA
ncbi:MULTISPECIES: SDR family NAD(P)-dependent oxidoreductase [unclassified Pedobacter]|uniref:SDR family NAD(P)-dependent oxidoreductase n=1 Tax=unclassified Pedobacter TaxID=2628915 RepID=UPI00142063FE|nr:MULTISPECIES: SDR family oxidoreductase [unclassified Pedobacter]NII80978.1 3-oxoacyl-[acyl-carrier protein] reductase [Pedobacter sp. SG908]NMN34993.1 3-oxoacyl-[acyl-carrier protein] reductase [Pedobacter sp. SG918]